MPLFPVAYLFDHTPAARETLEVVAHRFPHRREKVQPRSRTYYDTFDWRLFGKRSFLYTQSNGLTSVLYWQRLDGTPLQRAAVLTRPGFAWDLPAGPLLDQLSPILAMRRLLPVLTIASRTESLAILDSRQKTVARLELTHSTGHPAQGGSPSAELPVTMTLVPVRGYDQDYETVRSLLEESGAVPTQESEFSLATRRTHIEPGSYSRKLNLSLDPAMRSDEAVIVILRRLLQIMRQNEAGLRANTDSEFLHDFRVAVRRTRSALTQLRGVLPPKAVKHFKTEFSWLGQLTGPTRDLDVYQLKMPAYRNSLPATLRAELDPLEDFLERHQRLEHGTLVQLLDSERYAQLLVDWQRFLERPTDLHSVEPEAATTILDLASRRVRRSARRVLAKGSVIEPDSPPEALHRLRIECKKLRYLLEFFRSLFPAGQLAPLIDSLKQLQDNLGDFNDLEIQQGKLTEFAQTMMVEKLGTAGSLMAMGCLVDRLEQRQLEARRVFHRRFEDFSNRKNRRRFKKLFRLSGVPEA